MCCCDAKKSNHKHLSNFDAAVDLEFLLMSSRPQVITFEYVFDKHLVLLLYNFKLISSSIILAI